MRNDPYHRFYLSRNYQFVDIIHTVYKVVRHTPAGAWIIEDIPGGQERWVGHTVKAFAYQDVQLAWHSFNIRIRKRLIHAQSELLAVEAAVAFIENTSVGPEGYTRVIDGDENNTALNKIFDYLGRP